MISNDYCFIPYESEYDSESKMTIKDYLKGITFFGKDNPSIAFLIGPEGGFSDEEIETARKSGIKTVTLGARILRTETAAPAVMSMLQYEMNEF
jgi:16S rRNA (uracil1498-N3)-methyltransferase